MATDLSLLNDAQILELEFLLAKRAEFDSMSEAEEKKLMERAALEASSAAFFKASWHVLEPGNPLEWSWHYEYIGEHLDAVAKGQLTRLIINVPPRTAKSSGCTIAFPAWAWTWNPTLRFFTASYSATLSDDHSAKRRRLIESAWFQYYWTLEFTKDTNRRDQYRNTREGEMIASSVGATATGQGGNILILDDGLSADEAKSKLKRNNAHDWYINTFRKRLDDPAKGAIVIIEQRTHADDMTGWLLDNEPGQWTHVKVPLEQPERQQYSFPSGRIFWREAGDVIQPKRFTPAVVAANKIHKRNFATQDQQEPAPDTGNIFQAEWWKYRKARRPYYDRIITSWDLAVEGNADSDYNAGVVLGQFGPEIDVLDVHREKCAFPMQMQAVKNLAKKWPEAERHLIEKKANGPAVVATVKTELSGVLAIEPQGSKEQRYEAASIEPEAGQVFLIEAEWNHDFIEECRVAPNGKNDDQCDAYSQGANWLRRHNLPYGLLAEREEELKTQAKTKEEYMANANQMTKPDRGIQAVECPNCKGRAVIIIMQKYRCNACGWSWPMKATAELGDKPVVSTPNPWMRK